jgi:hypothetical protein
MRSRQKEAMIARRTGVLACAAAVCVPLVAHGERQSGIGALAVALEYAAAPNCPDAGEFKAIVVGRLGYDAFHEGAPERVLVQIESRGPAFDGRIEWRDAEGKWAGDRTFPSRSDDCRDLARAMAFALALQIQLSANASTPAASSAATPAETGRMAAAPAPPPAPPVTTPLSSEQRTVPAPTEAAKSPDRRARPVLAIGAGALVGFGMSASPVPFGRVLGSVAWPHWSLELAAEVGLPSTVRRADGASFSQQELLVGVAGCGALAPWSACLLAKGGAIRIVGNIDVPTSPWGPLVETGLRLAVTQPLGRRVYLAAQVEGLLIVTRWRVTLDQNLVWTSSHFAETIGLDLGVRFP